ncbi:hypothetical protein HK405_006137, partial [Cladochytrium tenue]
MARAARVGVAIVELLYTSAIAIAASAAAADAPTTVVTDSTTAPTSADQNPLVNLTLILPLAYASIEYFKPKSLYDPDLLSGIFQSVDAASQLAIDEANANQDILPGANISIKRVDILMGNALSPRYDQPAAVAVHEAIVTEPN